VVAAGRFLLVVAVVAAESSAEHQSTGPVLPVVLVVLAVCMLAVWTVKYLMTRWALDGPTLRIESGLLKRDARQLPLARIQAVDVVRPFMARTVGLAELKIRLAGSARAGGRLAYLSDAVAVDLRARLLAGHHGLDMATPEPPERPMAAVETGQLVASVVLSQVPAIAVALLVLIAVVVVVTPAVAAAAAGTFAVYIVSFARVTWRRVAEEYGFSVGLAPDGIRVRRGLFSTVSETVPFARVQAVRKIEPVLWRLLGWCRLEVDVAGSPGKEQGTRSGRVTKSLLPVGSRQLADGLFTSLLGLRQFQLERPPARAWWKAPLSYHFLAAGCDGAVVASSTGRLQKVTVWVPLEKVQSVRRVEGPLQRALRLATVHVDVAGRRVRAELRDRDVAEADRFFDQLVDQSRAARRRASACSSTATVPPVTVPPIVASPAGAAPAAALPAGAPWVGRALSGVPSAAALPTEPPVGGAPGPREVAVPFPAVGQPLPPPDVALRLGDRQADDQEVSERRPGAQ
jgi:putative membrane protein